MTIEKNSDSPGEHDGLGAQLRRLADREIDGLHLTSPAVATVVPLADRRRTRGARRLTAAAAVALVAVAGGWWVATQGSETVVDGPATPNGDAAAVVRDAFDAVRRGGWQGTLTLPDSGTDALRFADGAWELQTADGTVQRFIDDAIWQGTVGTDGTIDWQTAPVDAIDPFGRLFRSLDDAISTDKAISTGGATGADGPTASVAVDPDACAGGEEPNTAECVVDLTIDNGRVTRIEFDDNHGHVVITIGPDDPGIEVTAPR